MEPHKPEATLPKEDQDTSDVKAKLENLDINKEEPATAIYKEEEKTSKNIEIDIPKPQNDDSGKKFTKDKDRKSRSRSRSEDIDKKKKRKKKKGKKNRRTYEDKLTDPKVIQLTKLAIDNDPNIPLNLKDKFKKYETDLLTLCITNLPLNITHHEIKEYFNTFIMGLDPKYETIGYDPVYSVEKGDKKNYAVLTLNDKDPVEKLLEMDNMEYSNFKLKIERPRGFFSKIYAVTDQEDALNTDLANLEEIKVYMGNIPQYMGEDDLKKLCGSFGQIKAFNLIRDYSGDVPISKGYAFFEFVDPRVTDRAIKQLNC
jgi:RNA recognition motif-containing protein